MRLAALLLALAAMLAGGCRKDSSNSTGTGSPATPPVEASIHAAASGGTDGGAPIFGDWFALGSGCRAKFDLPEGDVSVTFHGPSDGGDWVHHARFRLEKFELYANGQPTKLARECAIRLNLNPPPHARIVSVRALTSVESEKPKAADLVLFSELRIGNTPLARTSQHFDATGLRRKTAESFDLSSGKDPAMPMPDLGCGEPKILGFDFTWIADSTAAERPVHVTLGHDRTLTLEVRLAPCP